MLPTGPNSDVLHPTRGWPTSSRTRADVLTPVLAAWLVQPLQHIGSAAVSGLVAKPIVDIVAIVGDIDIAAAAEEPLV